VLDPVRLVIGEAGEMAKFIGSVMRAIPDTRRFSTEVVHQAGTIILSSGLIIWLMEWVMGDECGLEASYTLKQIGAPLYSGTFNAWCSVRVMAPYMWGYILAAKVGCGLVAEIGSMRISDEIDAMEVMGIPSKTFLVATRVLALWIAMPFLYIVGLGVMFVSEYVVTVAVLQGVSAGGYGYTFWGFQNPYDTLASLTKIMTTGTAIVLVSCYFGYNARGGPVGVGIATAKSMMLNMILVHALNLFCTEVFWGLSTNAPIAS
jgi:phospholipid/cholesterol/gamma-HCH transport system permease protein